MKRVANKNDILIKENVDYLIDDDPNICINASKNNICTLYFKNNACEKIENVNNVINVTNWGEIYKFFMYKNLVND